MNHAASEYFTINRVFRTSFQKYICFLALSMLPLLVVGCVQSEATHQPQPKHGQVEAARASISNFETSQMMGSGVDERYQVILERLRFDDEPEHQLIIDQDRLDPSFLEVGQDEPGLGLTREEPRQLKLERRLENSVALDDVSAEQFFADQPTSLMEFESAYSGLELLVSRLDGLAAAESALQPEIVESQKAIKDQRLSPAIVDWMKNADDEQLRGLIPWLKRGGFGHWGIGPERIVNEDIPLVINPISEDLSAIELEGVRSLEDLEADGSGDSMEDLLGKNQILPISFLGAGARVQTAIAAVAVHASDQQIERMMLHGSRPQIVATAFLIAPNYVMTNCHVLPYWSTAQTRDLYFDFNHEGGGFEWFNKVERWRMDPGKGYWKNEKLDWAIVWCEPMTSTPRNRLTLPLREYGPYIPTLRINMVHHPWGLSKRVSLQSNRLESIQPDYRLFYRTDTFKGSSGSPLFDNRWRLVGIHSESDPNMTVNGEYLYNIGIRIDGIIDSVEATVTDPDALKRVLQQ